MKTRSILATAAVAVTATGVMLATAMPANAQSVETQQTQVLERAAEILGVPSSQFSDALKQAQVEFIEFQIQSDEIDAETGIALIQQVDDSNGLYFVEERKARSSFVEQYKNDVLEFLNVSETEFRGYLQDGETLLDIAEDKNIDENALRIFLTELHIESIESNQSLTDEQKAEKIEKVDEIVEKILTFAPPSQLKGFVTDTETFELE